MRRDSRWAVGWKMAMRMRMDQGLAEEWEKVMQMD